MFDIDEIMSLYDYYADDTDAVNNLFLCNSAMDAYENDYLVKEEED